MATSHLLGLLRGALTAGQELVEAWLAEKRAHGDTVPAECHAVIAQIEVADAVLHT
jgi:hypothetical protein